MRQGSKGSRLAWLLVSFLAVAVAGCSNSDDDDGFDGGGSGPAVPTLPPDIGNDGESTYLNIVPPGANGNSNGNIQGQAPLGEVENFQDQLRLYEELAFSPRNLGAEPCTPPVDTAEHAANDRSLACSHFKHAGLVPDRVDSEVTLTNPRTGGTVLVQRDGWGVPFVFADSREDAMYGVGYVGAQDRLFLHDVLRHVGRGQLSQFLGPEASFFAFDVDIANVAGYTEEEMTAMVERADQMGELGDVMLSDIDNLVAGINGYLGFLQTPEGFGEVPQEYLTIVLPNLSFPPRPWNRNDIVASAILIQSIFAVGGGGEHRNLIQLQTSDPTLGPGSTSIPQAACELWRDLRHAQDPDTTYTSERSFPTQSPSSLNESCPQNLPDGAAIWDVDSFQTRVSLVVTDTGIPVPVPNLPDATGIDLSPLGDVLGMLGGGGAGAAGEGGGSALLCAPATLPLLGGECAPIDAAPAIGQSSHSRSTLLAATLPDPGVANQVPLKPRVVVKQPEKKMLTASLDPFEGARESLCAAGLCVPHTMSNFIGVPGRETEDGFPIAVMGPQAGYFLAQLLWEVSVVSGGDSPGPLDFAGRGVIFADLPYINIGRGLDFAWSATSGNSDLVDIRVSRMCNLDGSPPSRDDADGDGFPDADGYLYDDECRLFDRRTDSWVSSPTVASVASGGSPTLHTVDRLVLRTHYGPVMATATVNGEPVAVSIQRSTFFGELDTAPPFALASTRGVENFDDFSRLFNSVTGTFNWLYADSEDIAWFHSGLYPRRHPEQHPELPVWGDGRFEWENMRTLPDGYFDQRPYLSRVTVTAQGDELEGFFEWDGFLPFADHPREVNPPEGWLVSWNNNPARDWWASDANGSYGPIHRGDMLERRLEAFRATGRKHDIGSMVEIMSDAAHTDLRGQETLQHALDILRTMGSDPGLAEIPDLATLQQVIDLLQAWVDDGSNEWIVGAGTPGLGAYRRDRDNDGAYDHRAQVVLNDAWYQEMFDDVIPQVTNLNAQGASVLQGRFDAPGPIGSAFQNGWFQMVHGVLTQALEANDGVERTPTEYRRLQCAGEGASFADCRDALLTSLNDAIALLGGLDNQDNWDGTQLYGTTVEEHDAIVHTAISAGSVPPMHWSNRPTFQQVVQAKGEKPR